MPSFARLPASPRPAGYYTTNDTRVSGAVGFTCIPCGDGNFCAGAKASAASSATRVPCGQFTSTSGNQYATSSTQCSERPPSQPASLCLSLLGWGRSSIAASPLVCPRRGRGRLRLGLGQHVDCVPQGLLVSAPCGGEREGSAAGSPASLAVALGGPTRAHRSRLSPRQPLAPSLQQPGQQLPGVHSLLGWSHDPGDWHQRLGRLPGAGWLLLLGRQGDRLFSRHVQGELG